MQPQPHLYAHLRAVPFARSGTLALHAPDCHHASRPDPNAPDLDDDGHLEPDFPCTLREIDRPLSLEGF
jgi:hypothetical protein